jgi:hypothetical protein
MTRRLVMAAVLAGLVVGGAVIAYQTSRPSGRPSLNGWLYTDHSTAMFIQWTRAGNGVTGSLATASISGPAATTVDTNNAAFTGSINHGSVTLTFALGLGAANGQLSKNELVLSFPASTGGLNEATFHPSTVDAYNTAVAGLQSKAQQTAQAQQNAQAQAQAQADAQAAAQARADEARRQAEAAQQQVDAQTLLATFRSSCRSHAGSLTATAPSERGYDYRGPDSAGEYCVVSYPGQGSFGVPIDPSTGTFQQEAASANQNQCQADASNASASAANRSPWSAQPQYHPDSGVCFHGTS